MQNELWLTSLEDMLKKLPGPKEERFASAFSHGTLNVMIYAPRKEDPQTPHSKDEVYVVMKGHGFFIRGEERREFKEKDLLFVPARMPHRFEDFSDDLTLWVIFYGPEGGEKNT